MSNSNVEEYAFQIIRFMVETGQRLYLWRDVRQALGMSASEFEVAYNYLNGNGCCHIAGQPGDDAQLFVDKPAYPFYSKLKESRVNLSIDAELLLKFLVENLKPNLPYSSGDFVIRTLGWGENRYMEAAQILADEGYIKGFKADNNPFWEVTLLPEGRKIVRANFRKPLTMGGAVFTGNITTTIEGSNNQLAIGSILNAASQSIQINPSLSDDKKGEIKNLLDQLNSLLQQVPEERVDDAEAVAEMARRLVENAGKEKPNKSLVKINMDGLKKAAEQVGSIIPNVLITAQAIMDFVRANVTNVS